MSTLYANFLAGTITDSPLSNSATTVNSANFANLPVVSGGDIMHLVLDPDASAGAPEIVTVTAHTSSATSVTVTRGAQSTSARSHASGTVWRAAFTKADADQLAAIIADGAIDTANLAAGAVTPAKLGTDERAYDASGTQTSGTATISWDSSASTGFGLALSSPTELTAGQDGLYVIALAATGSSVSGELTFKVVSTDLTGGTLTPQLLALGLDANERASTGTAVYLNAGDVLTVTVTATGGGGTWQDLSLASAIVGLGTI